jgi:cytochrome c
VKILAAMLAVVFSGAAFLVDAADDAAAEALIKKSKCLTCHSIDKKKDGPSYKEVAAKYKGKPDAEQKLYTHLTTHPKVKVDGKEEAHDSLKTTNESEIRNVIAWILSR